MRIVTIQSKFANSAQLFGYARQEPLLIVTETGEKFVLTRADNFEEEIEALRNSESFQSFLDQRMSESRRRPIEALLAEVETELRKG